MTTLYPQGRAVTPEQKRAVIERVYTAWCAQPEQRLGQFIDNACDLADGPRTRIAEDQWLATACELYAKRPRVCGRCHKPDARDGARLCEACFLEEVKGSGR